MLACGLLLLATQARAQGMLPLWEAKSARGTVYLLGSVHACSAGCFPLSNSILRRLDASKRVALELDPNKAENQMALMNAASIPPGEPGLDSQLGSGDLRRLRAVLGQLGLPEELVLRFRPWMASSLLVIAAAQRQGLSSEQGVDVWVLQRAQSRGLPVSELETVERQIQALSYGSKAEQLQSLRQTLELFEKNRIGGYLEDMVAAWRKGDAARIQALLNEGEMLPERMRIELLDRRNAEMSARIQQWTERGEQVFAVVGMGHLVGPNNIGELLAKRGYTVRQLREGE